MDGKRLDPDTAGRGTDRRVTLSLGGGRGPRKGFDNKNERSSVNRCSQDLLGNPYAQLDHRDPPTDPRSHGNEGGSRDGESGVEVVDVLFYYYERRISPMFLSYES